MKLGYYTIQELDSDNKPTVCQVEAEKGKVLIMRYAAGYEREDVFGPKARFKVLAGPWELPRGMAQELPRELTQADVDAARKQAEEAEASLLQTLSGFQAKGKVQ